MIWARYSSSAATIWTGPFGDEVDRDLRPERLLALDELLDDPIEQDRPDAAEVAAALDARHRDEVLDHPLEPLGLRGDADEELVARLRVEPRPAAEQQLRPAVDRGDRRPELVRQHAQEAIADLVRLVAPGDVGDHGDLERPAVELERAAGDLGREVRAVDPPAGRLGAEDRALAGRGRRLVLVERDEVGRAGRRSAGPPAQPNSSPAWRVAQVTRLFVVERQDRVRVRLEQGAEARLAGADRCATPRPRAAPRRAR